MNIVNLTAEKWCVSALGLNNIQYDNTTETFDYRFATLKMS